jgi:hypothetical protein
MGDVDWNHPTGNLYRVGKDLKPVRMAEKVCCSKRHRLVAGRQNHVFL